MYRIRARQVERCRGLDPEVVHPHVRVSVRGVEALVTGGAPRVPCGAVLARVGITHQRHHTLCGRDVAVGGRDIGPVALVDADVIHVHLAGELAGGDIVIRAEAAAHREVQDDVHRVVEWPRVVVRTGRFGVAVVGVLDVPIDPEPYLVG